MPRIATASDAWSVRSPATTSQPRPLRLSGGLVERTSARTRNPRAIKARATADPRKPEPPVTRTGSPGCRDTLIGHLLSAVCQPALTYRPRHRARQANAHRHDRRKSPSLLPCRRYSEVRGCRPWLDIGVLPGRDQFQRFRNLRVLCWKVMGCANLPSSSRGAPDGEASSLSTAL